MSRLCHTGVIRLSSAVCSVPVNTSVSQAGNVGLVYVRIVAAYNLMNSDGVDSLSDAFVRVRVGDQSMRTFIVYDDLNPRWDAAPLLFSVPRVGQRQCTCRCAWALWPGVSCLVVCVSSFRVMTSASYPRCSLFATGLCSSPFCSIKPFQPGGSVAYALVVSSRL